MFIINPYIFGAAGYTIENAVYFDGSADRLTFTPSGASSTPDLYCISYWAKRSGFGNTHYNVISGGANGYDSTLRYTNYSSYREAIQFYANGGPDRLVTNAAFADSTAWHHVFARYDSNASGGSSDYMQLWVNGVRLTSFADSGMPSTGENSTLFDGNIIAVGAYNHSGTTYYNGYLAEVIASDGQNHTVSDFGEFDSNGVWVPVEPPTSMGTNGFHLDFKSADIGNDAAGSNNFTPDSMGVNNVVVDTCTDSSDTDVTLFPCLDPNNKESSLVLSSSNLKAENDSASNWQSVLGTMGLSSGRYYWEVTRVFSGHGYEHWGVVGDGKVASDLNRGSAGTILFDTNGSGIRFYNENANPDAELYYGSATGSTSGDVIGVDLDVDNDTIELIIGGTGRGTKSTSGLAKPLFPVTMITSGGSVDHIYNFGASSYTHTKPTGASNITQTATGVGNYATLNSLDLASSTVLSNGNLRCTSGSNFFDNNYAFSTIAMSTGKFYVTSLPTDTGKYLGIANASVTTDIATANDVHIYWDSSAPRMVYWNGSNNNLTPSPTEVRGFDQLGIALNATNGDYWVGWYDRSGSAWYWYNSSASNWTGNPDSDSGKSGTLSGGPYRFMIGCNASGTHDIDFGQGTLWDNITELTNFKQLNTANLPAPTVTNPSDFFKTVLYTANNSDGHEISTVGFVPDFVWIKDRDTAASHVIFDVVRGVSPSANNYVTVNTNDAENQGSFTNTMVQLGKAANGSTVINGFTLDDDSNDQRVNFGGSMVAWCWKAGGAASSNSNGSITSQVSAASHGGFSIITYTGNGSAGATIGHGLSKAAEFQMFRQRNAGNDFHVSTNITGSIIGAELNNATNSIGSGAVSAAVTAFNETTTALAASGVVNDSSDTYVSYAFARTPGLIGIGTYAGNNSTNGTYVIIDDGASGFRPAWVMLKNLNDSENWVIFDSARSTFNPVDGYLSPVTTAGDGSATGLPLDFTANGFKQRNNSNMTNENTILYLAFAEHPFGGVSVAQAKAR